jgi:hypothetical protein
MSTETPWPTPLPSPHEDENPQRSARPLWPALRADVIAFAVVAGAGVVAAFPVGALWRSTAPAVLGVVNQGEVYLAAPETKTFVARDGWFALYACIAAVLLALFAFLAYRRKAGTGAALGLAAGGIAGGYLASWFGSVIGPGRGSITRAAEAVASGTNFTMPLSVRAVGVIWLWPAVAAGLFFFLMLLFGPSEPEPDQQPFSGWGEYHADADTGHATQNGFGGSPDESASRTSGDTPDEHRDPPQP